MPDCLRFDNEVALAGEGRNSSSNNEPASTNPGLCLTYNSRHYDRSYLVDGEVSRVPRMDVP
jgi:hypothetical protein